MLSEFIGKERLRGKRREHDDIGKSRKREREGEEKSGGNMR